MQTHHHPRPIPFQSLSLLCVLGAVAVNVCSAGPLTPPAGPVAPTPGPEPRIAINATNTPGDANSVFRITQPGSYYLTGNVTGQAAKHGIEVAANAVTIDLNGFALIGVVGSLTGVISDIAADTGITLINGSIRTWGQSGVNFFSFQTLDCLLDRLVVSGNGSSGIVTANNARMSNCVASDNTASGFNTGSGCLATNCTAEDNGSYGITTGGNTTVSNCTSTSNASGGISVGTGSTVIGCTASSNSGWGIGTSSECLVIDCNAGRNAEDGIRCAGSGSLIRGNVCATNGINTGDGAGIVVVSVENRIENNQCTNNDRGIEVSAAGNLIFRNSCADNTTNWVIVANNVYGPILDRTAVVGAAVNGNAATSTLGSTDANANYSY